MRTRTLAKRPSRFMVATAAALLATLLTACDLDEPPVSVEKNSEMTMVGETPFIRITAKVDKVKLTGLKINRGNCNWGASQKRPPVDMVFGNTLTYVALGCTITEVNLETDQGDYTFTF